MLKNIRGGTLFIVVIVALCVWSVSELKPRLGIDLQGGTELTYRVGLPDNAAAWERYRTTGGRTPAQDAKDVIELRLNATGVTDITVSVLDR